MLHHIRLKWGLGHSGLFPEAKQFAGAFKKLLSVLLFTKCLPVQAVMNSWAPIPKNMSHVSQCSAVEGGRTIHVYSAFSQNMLKVAKRRWGMGTHANNAFGAVKEMG